MPVLAKSDRRVIFHADDFGMSSAVNEGILTAFREGLLTSTSLLANAPAAVEACREWPVLISKHQTGQLVSSETRRELSDPSMAFDLGIHLNLTQGRPLSAPDYPAELLDDLGNFAGIGATFYRLRRATSSQLTAVTHELRLQIEWMCERGLKPSHLNGHQYVELIPQVSAMIPEILGRYSIPVVRMARESNLTRNVLLRGRVVDWGIGLVKRYYAEAFCRRLRHSQFAFPDQFFGTSHAGRIDLRTLTKFFKSIGGAAATEIGVHPGISAVEGLPTESDPWFDPLSRFRPKELEWLRGAQLRDQLIQHRLKLGRLQLLNSALHR